jgi:hypothetical protein
MKRSLLTLLWLLLLLSPAFADKKPVNPNGTGGKTDEELRTTATCLPSTASATLDINNVRALLHNGGDMWWDLVGNPRYEVPKVTTPADARHALFAGSLWIGGIDASGQLRIAAATYRQSGNDFYPGPIRDISAGSSAGTTEATYCTRWDRQFRVNKADIDAFRSEADQLRAGTIQSINLSAYPEIIAWPGNNTDAGFDPLLAPFEDTNNNLLYEPASGDYPKILGDQAVFWVINDKGNIHTESQSQQIGLEIQMLAFSFISANAINDMTFYRQTVINRSTSSLNQTYIGQWVDADLGFAFDDYVGCDTVRGLGFAYNGDANDNPPQGYGLYPPAVGVDFFQGPTADANDGVDNNKNGIVDEANERWGMAKFVYYENDFSVRGNPSNASHYYQYLKGFWRNNAPIIDDRVGNGGNGNGFPDGTEQVKPTSYIFPDYPGSRCAGVTKTTNANPFKETITPFDRRFLQSAGPFTLQPGSTNEIIVGVVWARDPSGSLDNDQLGSVCALLQADDIAQALFDNNFRLLGGPDAPDLAAEELDQELILSWDYSKKSPTTTNNFYENYQEFDPILSKLPGLPRDKQDFRFQGYVVYQLASERVSVSDLSNANLARLVAQCDLKDNVSVVKNRTVQRVPGLSDPVITDVIQVQGANTGIFRSIKITEDKFTSGTTRNLVNYRPYYFAVLAYAQNDTSSDGRQFVPSSQFRILKAIPHKTSFENFGEVLNSDYGRGPKITRLQGTGSGGNFLEITSESVQQLLETPYQTLPIYEPGLSAPVFVKVTNPKEVKPYDYQLVLTRNKFINTQIIDSTAANGSIDSVFADWELYRKLSNNTFSLVMRSLYSKRKFASGLVQAPVPAPFSGTEKIIREATSSGFIDHGISISVFDAPQSGDTTQLSNGLVGSSITYADASKQWLTGYPDINESSNLLNWIRSGSKSCQDNLPESDPKGCKGEFNRDWYDQVYKDNRAYDPDRAFETTVSSRWIAPYVLAAGFNTATDILGPRLRFQINPSQPNPNTDAQLSEFVTLDKLPNVNIVITKDRTKWSRCVVVETSPTQTTALNPQGGVGGAPILAARWAKGKDINGVESNDPNDYGLSWFPGYAVNVDNGERVNIFFGEASFYKTSNGADMLFNPSRSDFSFIAGFGAKSASGRHYLYVTNQRYDSCNKIRKFLQVGGAAAIDQTGAGLSFANPAVRLDSAYKHVAWVAIPAVSDQLYNYSSYDGIPTDVTIKLRVSNKFSSAATPAQTSIFNFTMQSYAVVDSNRATAKSALDLIRMVPNPFYGRSGVGAGRYEVSQLDVRGKITNLPQRCTIRIFTLNGNLVRVFNKNSDVPNQDWDMKNEAGVPIASGVYIIHIDAGELGTKVVRFFAIMPEIDLNAY